MRAQLRRLEPELERRVDALGFEVVDISWAGSKARPTLRLRIDREGAVQGSGITLEECARVSRALEEWLDGSTDLPDRYVLEVSSPGLDRPLVRPAHWQRFIGHRVAVKGKAVLAGRARRLEGELIEFAERAPESASVRLRLDGGDEVELGRDEIEEAHLIYSWE